MLQVRVVKVSSGKIQLSMRSAAEIAHKADMDSGKGLGAGSSKKAKTAMEAALAKMGYKHTPKNEEGKVRPHLLAHVKLSAALKSPALAHVSAVHVSAGCCLQHSMHDLYVDMSGQSSSGQIVPSQDDLCNACPGNDSSAPWPCF